MNRFVKKIVVFNIIALLTIIMIMLASNYIIKSNANFKIDKAVTKLVLGHSHSECSINDSILSNSINLSASGESYFYNYQKLKKVVSSNKNINTVFIEFANNHVDSIMDDWIWGYQKMSYYLQYYSPFMNSEDLKLLFDNNSTDLLASYSIATRKHLYRIMTNDYNLIDDIGGFSGSKLSKVDEMISENKFNASISKNLTLSIKNLDYLRKIINFCRENNIQPFLIRSPQHQLYADLINEDIYQNVLKTKFNDVELLDFDGMNFPNNHYLDLHHLNLKGANQFTTFINNLIEDGLLSAKNKEAIIKKEIEVFNKKEVKSSN